MKSPKISVIIPVYNVEPYLRKCLDSVINQTYRNLEIIIVDDGSPDNCGAICDEYAAKDSRVWVIHQKNGGVSAARNAGLERASGDFIGFVDADDFAEPDMYEYLLALIQEDGADIAQCGYTTENGNPQFVFPKSAFAGDAASWKKLSNHNWNKLYRAETIRGLCFELFPIGEDLLFNIDAIAMTQSIVFGSEAKYHYTTHNASASLKSPTLHTLLSARRVFERILELFKDDPTAYTYFREEFFRNELDVCSKIVRFYRPEFENAKEEIRHNLRACTAEIKAIHGFSRAERIKFWLISYAWPLYRILLLTSKKLPKRR